MLLKIDKARLIWVYFLKYSYLFLLLFALAINPCSGSSGAGKDRYEIKQIISKIKVKVNYTEGPSQADFFTRSEAGNYIDLLPFKSLKGLWTGKFYLDQESVFWTNANLEEKRIFDLIDFGPYDVFFKFKLRGDDLLEGLELFQSDVRYDSVNIELLSDKQLNYWAKAVTKNWVEVIKGKVFKTGEEELFTVFQTTVYIKDKKRIPIYAFKGQLVLRKIEG